MLSLEKDMWNGEHRGSSVYSMLFPVVAVMLNAKANYLIKAQPFPS
jgi:hypothetical protein